MMKEYSYEECMRCIPECDQELLIQNMIASGNLHRLTSGITFYNVSELIDQHAIWEDTPQGFLYWSDRCRSSRHLTRGYSQITKLTFEEKLEELSI